MSESSFAGAENSQTAMDTATRSASVAVAGAPVLAEELSQVIGQQLQMIVTVEPLRLATHEVGVLDEKAKFLARSVRGEILGVVVCSPPNAPDTMQHTTAKTMGIKQRLGPDLGRVILQPRATGLACGRSFTLLRCASAWLRCPCGTCSG